MKGSILALVIGWCSFLTLAQLLPAAGAQLLDFDVGSVLGAREQVEARIFGYVHEEVEVYEDFGFDLVQILTPSGLINGQTLTSRERSRYYSFRGIPYAEPPIGPRRFQEPVAKKPWIDPLNATRFGPRCVQERENPRYRNRKELIGDEDCLYLNVYCPRLPKAGTRSPPQGSLNPVIVYIHGGGFSSGASNEYPPDLFMTKDVVLVTLNYRLGVLGFLSLGNQYISGNMGLKDQVEALRWVNANIVSFGGDPNKVTLIGGAQGGVSTHLHQVSPLGSGLYHGVVSMTGMSTFSKVALSRRLNEKMGARFVHGIGCYDNTEAFGTYGTAECLREKSVYQLYSSLEVVTERHEEHGIIAFMPTVDDYATTPFLPQHPMQILKQGQQKNIPTCAGITQNEGAMNLAIIWDKLDDFDENFGTYGPKLMYGVDSNEITPQMQVVANATRQFYTGERFSRHQPQGIINMLTDIDFLAPLYESITVQSTTQFQPVYFYEVTHAPAESFLPVYGQGTSAEHQNWGITHGDDQFFLFGSISGRNGITIKEDRQTSLNMLNMFTNFAKYQDPTPYQDDDTPAWRPFSPKEENYIEIKPRLETRVGVHSARMLYIKRVVTVDLDLSLAPLPKMPPPTQLNTYGLLPQFPKPSPALPNPAPPALPQQGFPNTPYTSPYGPNPFFSPQSQYSLNTYYG